MVETPVQEQVSLYDGRVQVDHRKVDRPVTAADKALFADKTIELEEAWWTEIDEEQLAVEFRFLERKIYLRAVDLRQEVRTAYERYRAA